MASPKERQGLWGISQKIRRHPYVSGAVALGVGTVAAVGIACGPKIVGEEDPTRTPVSAVETPVATIQVEPSFTPILETFTPTAEITIAPTTTSTPEIVDPQIELFDIGRDNYLRFFDTSEFIFRDREIRLEPTDEDSDYLRTFKKPDSDGRPVRWGVNVEKLDRATGDVLDEISDFNELFGYMASVEGQEDGIAVIMARYQDVIGAVDRSFGEPGLGFVHVSVIIDRGNECLFAGYQVEKLTGKDIQVASEVGQNAEGECDR